MKYFVLLLILSFSGIVRSQNDGNWVHLDPIDDGVPGISTYKAYDLLKNRKADTVVVAILDNGAAIDHEDLAGVIWLNKNEIPDNGIDDDNNGYIDDMHGWNFLGNAKGENLKMETTGLTRKYSMLHYTFIHADREFILSHPDVYDEYQMIDSLFKSEVESKQMQLENLINTQKEITKSIQLVRQLTEKEDFTLENIKAINPKNATEEKAKNICLTMKQRNINDDYFQIAIRNVEKELATRLNPDFDNRKLLVGDNPDDLNDTVYGNNQVWARGPSHGTSVAGVIGALHNELGYSGIARHVKLMILRIVPNGDERDKDIALAIRYAVNNGADVINCSFGKTYGTHPEWVAEAIAEAEAKNVLIVKGSGNNSLNVDITPYHPLNLKPDGTEANNVITVGASGSADNKELVAGFSNYGAQKVDVFAPGVGVGSCQLNHQYSVASGTSIASPVVAGMAAVIKSHYPNLSAKELKEVILQSVYIPKTKEIIVPNPDRKRETYTSSLNEMCKTGGIVNLYRAILLIENQKN